MQVYDYGMDSPMFQEWPFLPWFNFPPEDRHPRRMYLPMEDGSSPMKEHIGHTAQVIGGQDPITEQLESTLEVTFYFANPREYDITLTSGTTFVNPSVEFGDPIITDPGTNITAVIGGTPKRIDISGMVPAQSTETFTYELTVTPSGPGIRLITGNGVSFTGGANRQTVLTYTTPITQLS